jgi:hypothetical protein
VILDRAGPPAPAEESTRPCSCSGPVDPIPGSPTQRRLPTPSSSRRVLLPIAIRWMMCRRRHPARGHPHAPPKKPRSGPLAGSILAAKDLWPPAPSIRSAAGRRNGVVPARPTSHPAGSRRRGEAPARANRFLRRRRMRFSQGTDRAGASLGMTSRGIRQLSPLRSLRGEGAGRGWSPVPQRA